MKFYTFLLLFLILFAKINAQAIKFKGKVIDINSKVPIPYAIILLDGTDKGTTANDSGYFEFNLFDKFDDLTFIVHSLGYKKTRIKINDIHKQKEIIFKLEPSVFEMKEIVVTGNLKRFILGSKKQINLLLSEMPSIFDDKRNVFITQHALFLRNPKDNTGRFKNVSFFITNKGFPDAPFRIRIYETEGDSGKPGNDLLYESVIVNAKKGGEWFTVDISKYNVIFPEKGCIVAAEWIITDKKYFSEPEPGKFKNYGIVLGVTKEFKENLHWRFSSEHLWFKTNQLAEIYFNPMIRAEVEFAE